MVTKSRVKKHYRHVNGKLSIVRSHTRKTTTTSKIIRDKFGRITYIKRPNGTETRYKYFSNGQKEWEFNYKNGRREGKFYRWYKNGQKSYEENYKNGELDGKQSYWYDNGQKDSVDNYKNGKLNGRQYWWDDDGKKIDETIYSDGVKIYDMKDIYGKKKTYNPRRR